MARTFIIVHKPVGKTEEELSESVCQYLIMEHD